MTRAGRSGVHRSKKKRLIVALAPVAALAMAVPLMYSAGAATASEVETDCVNDSDKLENCEFVDVQVKRDSLGPNEQVSTVTDNCGTTEEAKKSFSVSASVKRVVEVGNGFAAGADAKLGASLLSVGIKYDSKDINLKRDETASSFSFTRTDTVEADHRAFFMWSAKRTDVSGYLRATYKDPQDGQTVFFSPSEGAATRHVFYPQILDNGTPAGRLWLRNVPCASENSIKADVADAGFGKAGANVTDVEIPLSEIKGLTVS
jgi:hypothetical protein